MVEPTSSKKRPNHQQHHCRHGYDLLAVCEEASAWLGTPSQTDNHRLVTLAIL